MRRDKKAELAILHQANSIINGVMAQRPSNPADTKRLLEIATVGMDAVDKANCAIGAIIAGPHADFDYIEIARYNLLEAENFLGIQGRFTSQQKESN